MTDSTPEAAESSLPALRWVPPPVYFMHIPKTAGSSLQWILKSAFWPGSVQFIGGRAAMKFTVSELAGLRCVVSHLGNGLLPYLPQNGLQKITVLRDPVERVVSFVNYRRSLLQEVPHWFDAEYVEKCKQYVNADLATWLDLFESDGNILANGQSKTLCAVGDPRPFFRDGDIGRTKVLPRGNWVENLLPREIDDAVLVERAHRQLEQVAVVGITENFAGTAELVCDVLGIAVPRALPVENVGRSRTGGLGVGYRATTTPDVIARIEAMTTIDRELYLHGQELFMRQLARLRARKRRTICMLPRLCAPYWQARRTAGRVKHLLRTKLHLALPA
jgi:hypothetical protein